MPVHRVLAKTIEASGTFGSPGSSSSINVSDFIEGLIYIDVTSVSGTNPSMTLTMQSSYDNSNWFDTGSSVTITSTGKTVIPIANFGLYIRFNRTLSGTDPSFTYSIVFLGKT